MLKSADRMLRRTVPPLLMVFQAAGAAVIYSTLSQRELSVGDRIMYTVTMLAPKGASVVPPDPAAGFGALAVKGWNSRKYERAQADSITFEYALTTYRAENCTIPPLSFIIESDDSSDTLMTESVPLAVIPLCTSDSADIMDLRPQQTAGKRPLLWLWLLLGACGIAAAALFARHCIRKLRKPPPPPPPRPPYDEAMEALAALEAKQYLMKGMIREHVFELSEILKRYLGRRFAVNAAEFTTEEMCAWIGIAPVGKEVRIPLEWFFRAADPVKFARFLPDSDTIERFGTEVRGIVEATKPFPDVPADTETAVKKAGGRL